jgi:hypothetical membrane protein
MTTEASPGQMTIRGPRARVLGGLALVLAPAVYVVTEAITAAAWTQPRYSYTENYVSDLGVTGPRETFLGHDIYSPLAPVMNAGFIADGLLALLATILIVRFRASRRAKAIWILSVLLAAGITLVGVFHGSRLSQQAGTIGLHFLGAPVAIIAGNVITILVGAGAAAFGLAPRFRRPLIILGIAGIAALAAEIVVMGGVPGFPAGICERLAVYAVLAAQLTLGLAATGGRRPAAATRHLAASSA